jgi:hypothetical protein
LVNGGQFKMFVSWATIKYERIGRDHKAYAIVDQGIVDYYFSLIPKYFIAQRQAYRAHITIVRNGRDFPKNLDFWAKYEGEKFQFEYSHEVEYDEKYLWINVKSERISKIRDQLGLFVRDNDNYHISIGNFKGKIGDKNGSNSSENREGLP